ncbi:hypothetical protein [Xenophilus sp. Marseille-Q4582]|uniref:hypothetical protein n=1 Tax=Xenophilus sp. Marseille-Q4582 TaxID=2866600 RepID=UPI001CE41A23|nr:hypothetical protein [Xenophilus sp. Marseille-Q4582]
MYEAIQSKSSTEKADCAVLGSLRPQCGRDMQHSDPVRDRSIIEREVDRLNEALGELGMTMAEHTDRLSPVLMSASTKQAAEGIAAEEDLGQLGNQLRECTRRVRGVLAQFADLRYRITI